MRAVLLAGATTVLFMPRRATIGLTHWASGVCLLRDQVIAARVRSCLSRNSPVDQEALSCPLV